MVSNDGSKTRDEVTDDPMCLVYYSSDVYVYKFNIAYGQMVKSMKHENPDAVKNLCTADLSSSSAPHIAELRLSLIPSTVSTAPEKLGVYRDTSWAGITDYTTSAQEAANTLALKFGKELDAKYMTWHGTESRNGHLEAVLLFWYDDRIATTTDKEPRWWLSITDISLRAGELLKYRCISNYRNFSIFINKEQAENFRITQKLKPGVSLTDNDESNTRYVMSTAKQWYSSSVSAVLNREMPTKNFLPHSVADNTLFGCNAPVVHPEIFLSAARLTIVSELNTRRGSYYSIQINKHVAMWRRDINKNRRDFSYMLYALLYTYLKVDGLFEQVKDTIRKLMDKFPESIKEHFNAYVADSGRRPSKKKNVVTAAAIRRCIHRAPGVYGYRLPCQRARAIARGRVDESAE